MIKKVILVIFLILSIVGCGKKDEAKAGSQQTVTIRAWHFPDIVHSAAIVGRERGAFQKSLGPNVKIKWKVFNAGPSAIEALFADEVDIGYIGPNPAINGYVRSQGKALRIVCGASSGGAGLVVRKNSGIKSKDDLVGKKIATPQLGNTQDVACRAWLKAQGFEVSEKGGSVQVIPVRNPDQLTLFIKEEIDGAWTKEPWVARLIKEGKGELFLDERSIWPEGKFVTAHIIVNTKFLQNHPELVKTWIRTHIELTEWINSNLEEAKNVINTGIEKITSKELPQDVLDDAFSRVTITYDPVKSSLFRSASWAYESGYLGTSQPDISRIYDLSILNQVLGEKKLEPVE